MHELSSSSEPTLRIVEVKAVITLRSGKKVEQLVPKLAEEDIEEKEAELEKIEIKDDAVKKSTPPPFPQAFKGKKKAINQAEILEVLRLVKVNIPLLDMIKQVPTYAKFLKDLCIVKKGLNFDKKAFLTEQVSTIIQCKTLVKYCLPLSIYTKNPSNVHSYKNLTLLLHPCYFG